MKVRIGVIGCGRIAQRFHIKTISKMDNAEIVALCDVRHEIAAEIAFRYRTKKVYSDYHELLDDSDVDAVVISTLPESHFEILANSAKAGKHVFVEKPLAYTVEECKKAIDLCQSNTVKLMVGFMRRFDKALIWSKQKMEAGDFGKALAINSTYNHVSAYVDYLKKTDVDIVGRGGSSPGYKENMYLFLINHLIHHADIMHWMGGSVERVLASATFCENNFSMNFILKFTNKSLGSIQFNSLVKSDWQETIVATCTRGRLEAKMFFPYSDIPSSVVFSSHEDCTCTSPLIVINTMYEDEMQHFVNCITNDLQPQPSGYDGLEAQKIVEAMEKSLKNESWIQMDN